MLRDRSSAPDTSFPYRPLYHVPARLGQNIGSNWYDPRGIGMYHRVEVRRGGTVLFAFPDWDEATEGPWLGNGTVAGKAGASETVTVNLEITGRVPPHEYIYTIRKVSSTGVITFENGVLNVSGPGAYTLSWTAVPSGTAQMDLGGNKEQFNLLDDT